MRSYKLQQENVHNISGQDPAPHNSPVRQGQGANSTHTSVSKGRQRTIRKNGNWTSEQLQNAIDAVDSGMSIRKAFSTYYILYSSLRGWCYGKTLSRHHGTKGELVVEEENQLVEYLIEMCNRDLGYHLHNSR